MIKNSNDITTRKEEAEERNGREAEVVQATSFQGVISEFESRHGYKSVMKNWYEGKERNGIITTGVKFNCTTITNTIAGRDFSRLGVLQR